AQAQTTIEPGSEDSASSSGDDAGYASDDYSSTSTSLSSSVRDYAFENGRRYHKFRQGHYALPNDDQEQHREDMKHAMTLAASGDRLHFAPLNAHPQQIVDLGTGTGIWAVEMGDAYPSAQVLGIDLSPIQPTWVPPNVRFMVDDAESEWLHPRDHFDLVHARHCLPAFKDWAGVFASAFAHVKPGGWMEVQDLQFVSQCDDGTMPETYALEKLFRLIGAGFQTMGVTLQGAPSLPEKMRAAGFEGVEVDVRKVPVGKWPKNPLLKKVGLYLQAVIMDGLEAVSLGPICRGLKWTREEVEVLLAEVRKDLRNSAIHSYVTMYTIYGQK
ncbi:S-adenosyl-L-methionine-dependent methyltransferase, partial [Viridothelium virens]